MLDAINKRHQHEMTFEAGLHDKELKIPLSEQDLGVDLNDDDKAALDQAIANSKSRFNLK